MPVNSILDVFARSPLKPLMQHIETVKQCSDVLIPFFNAVIDEKWDQAKEYRDKICSLEKEADALKHKLRMRLPGGLFMPVERTDMLELLTQQDKIANKAKDISGLVIGRQMTLPSSIQEAFHRYLARCLDAVAQANLAIQELNGLLESGFQGREVKLVTDMISKLHAIEHDTDTMQVEIRQEIFTLEKTLHPVDIIFLYKIIERVGGLADLSECVGARLEIMLVRA